MRSALLALAIGAMATVAYANAPWPPVRPTFHMPPPPPPVNIHPGPFVFPHPPPHPPLHVH